MAEFGGDGSVEVAVARGRCFEVAAAVAAYPDWHPVIKSMTPLAQDADGRASHARAVVDASVSTVTVEVGFSYSEPSRVECRRQSGDLSRMWTTFEFVELESGLTRVDYATSLDPGRMLSMLARGPVIEKVRTKLVDDALAGFKRVAESG